jgi:hypothetical protein
MEKFTPNNQDQQPDREVKKESVFGRMNRERSDREYSNIREQMAELSGLITRRDGGARGLEQQINQVAYKLKSSVGDFCINNPRDVRCIELKKLVGLS